MTPAENERTLLYTEEERSKHALLLCPGSKY
jgi:hypothetical protein